MHSVLYVRLARSVGAISRRLLQNCTKYYQILPNITKYYQIVPSIAKYYKACLARNVAAISQRLFPSIAIHQKYYQIAPSIAKYYQVLPSITKYYKVLPSIAKYYRVCLAPSVAAISRRSPTRQPALPPCPTPSRFSSKKAPSEKMQEFNNLKRLNPAPVANAG